ncbi:DUF2852 domain-containing protein [Polycladidibacter hongkongensis]|uniref:DUF2852 domain-containing protein n=1 Tax=Polycladidibacter hongkongensis TaxID=1647556 RepID=UPI0009E726E6|nr:DUF2852 domain-containing protein [Pseudovibrio hongkongensis]
MTCSKNLIRPEWTPATTAIMVIGFIVFWPLGLAMLAYILWGDNLHEFRSQANKKWDTSRFRDAVDGMGMQMRSGNVAFDDFREKELKRLEEERQKLEDMRKDFDNYMRDLRMAKDREEFDRFMAKRKTEPHTGGDQTTAAEGI